MSHFAANRFALLSDDSGSFAAKPAPKAAPAVEAAPAAAPKPRGNRASGPRTGAPRAPKSTAAEGEINAQLGERPPRANRDPARRTNNRAGQVARGGREFDRHSAPRHQSQKSMTHGKGNWGNVDMEKTAAGETPAADAADATAEVPATEEVAKPKEEEVDDSLTLDDFKATLAKPTYEVAPARKANQGSKLGDVTVLKSSILKTEAAPKAEAAPKKKTQAKSVVLDFGAPTYTPERPTHGKKHGNHASNPASVNLKDEELFPSLH
ncbi:hypothetical protein H696_00050 [Fonticula alba]|uniref:Hyaluronan/mRNA-binding protein domain-containing protein n=1 Tax=Fonticula alba TaxID=691883 RepID=A0A058ZEW6_FONAL|nr:hypothetical protein H696_00050 [Fonticula alba]KCV72458.1 hypothetical protein H696_00050 [Fonticula alba]|eukprot:XP_009492159.1 hypothetical protein H696_00050 [Fonticula alba]